MRQSIKMFTLASGDWNNSLFSGPGSLNLNNVRSNSNDNIGFCDSVFSLITHLADTGKRGIDCLALAKSSYLAFFGSASEHQGGQL